MTFIVNNIRWKTVFVPTDSFLLRRSDGSYTIGVTDRNTHCVYLSDILQGSKLRKVFTHETCHVICMSYDIHLPIEQEEFLCDFVATYGDEIFNIVNIMFEMLKEVA